MPFIRKDRVLVKTRLIFPRIRESSFNMTRGGGGGGGGGEEDIETRSLKF